MDNSEVEFKYPKQVNQYEIGKVIGSGSYGTVFEATHSNGEKVAIKIINILQLHENPLDFELVSSEIKLLKRLYHKNIIQIFEFLQDKSFIYIVTELCTEGELFEYIVKNQKLSEAEALSFFQELVDALNYIHDMEICHRDIKLDNILLTNGKRIKLIDFGYAIKYDRQNFLNDSFGTPAYACPEIHKSSNYHGTLADIWSLGVVLFAMVCGYLPFGNDDDDEQQISALITNGEFTIPNTLSENLIDLIKHLLEVNPCERFDFNQITQHAWFNSNNPVLIGGINLEITYYPIDDNILDFCEECKLIRERVRNDLIKNKFNENTVIYKMFVQQMIKLDEASKSDLFSEEFKAYLLDENSWIRDDDNEELIEKTPSGHFQTDIFVMKKSSSQDILPNKKYICSECERRNNLLIQSNNIKIFSNVKKVSSETFSILKCEKVETIIKEEEKVDNSIIQLIEFKNDDLNNSITSINLIDSTQTIQEKELLQNTFRPDNNKCSIKPKSCLRKADISQVMNRQNKKTTFMSPIKQKTNLLTKIRSGMPFNNNQIPKNSSVKIKDDADCIMPKGCLSLINTHYNNDNLFDFDSHGSKIRKIKTTKPPLLKIEEVSKEDNADISFDEKTNKSPINFQNISYSPKAPKLNNEVRMRMIPSLIKQDIIDNSKGVEDYEFLINKCNQINIFNQQAREIKARIEPNKLIKVKSMYNTKIYTENGNLDEETSKQILKKFPSKTKMQKIKESKSRFMTKSAFKKDN